MKPRLFYSLAAFALLGSLGLQGAESWTQLKIGMTSDEATESLGVPLLKTTSRGFELWIYDNNAEAVFFGGPLVGWTAPSVRKVAGVTIDVWQRKPGSDPTKVFVLSKATKRIDRRRDNNAGNSSSSASLYKIRN